MIRQVTRYMSEAAWVLGTLRVKQLQTTECGPIFPVTSFPILSTAKMLHEYSQLFVDEVCSSMYLSAQTVSVI